MTYIHFPLPKKYYFELAGMYLIRSIKDGLTVLETKIGLDRYESEHNPKFTFSLMLLNFNIFELNIYKTGVTHD